MRSLPVALFSATLAITSYAQNVEPSPSGSTPASPMKHHRHKKADAAEVAPTPAVTSPRYEGKPLPELIGELICTSRDGRTTIGWDNLGKPFNDSTAMFGNGSTSACAAVVKGHGNRHRVRPPMGTSKSWN
jgi:hypothetical protein